MRSESDAILEITLACRPAQPLNSALAEFRREPFGPADPPPGVQRRSSGGLRDGLRRSAFLPCIATRPGSMLRAACRRTRPRVGLRGLWRCSPTGRPSSSPPARAGRGAARRPLRPISRLLRARAASLIGPPSHHALRRRGRRDGPRRLPTPPDCPTPIRRRPSTPSPDRRARSRRNRASAPACGPQGRPSRNWRRRARRPRTGRYGRPARLLTSRPGDRTQGAWGLAKKNPAGLSRLTGGACRAVRNRSRPRLLARRHRSTRRAEYGDGRRPGQATEGRPPACSAAPSSRACEPRGAPASRGCGPGIASSPTTC